MKIGEMFPRKYASGEDLHGPAVMTIEHVKAEQMRGEQKWVVYFKGATKGVILSRLLASQIAQAVGSDETDQWAGKQVELYPERIQVAGTPRVAIRARKAKQ